MRIPPGRAGRGEGKGQNGVPHGGLTTKIKAATRGLDDGATGWQITRKTFIIFGV